MYGTSKPAIVRDLMTMSLRILLSAVPRWICPLAYGGPSWKTNFGAPRRFARICPYRSIASQRAIASGSAVCRFAFIGKPVRGRFTVSFHSGISLNSTAYNFGMAALAQLSALPANVHEQVLDN